MQTEWMGRYRPLVAVLVQHSNITARAASHSNEIGEGVFLNTVSWQVLEYLIEHRDDASCMTHIHEALGIPQSSFSKIARQLTDLGLVERYQSTANRKNIILKPSEKALRLYRSFSQRIYEKDFQSFFQDLDALDDDSLAVVISALQAFNRKLCSLTEPQRPAALVKKE